MRNLKKVLSLVLCMAMMLSVMVVGAGAAFKDQEKIVNDEAVDMCAALNIINGYTDGSFKPEGNITRAEACKMICVALNGGKEPVLGTNATASFTDIKGHWAEGYIEYCVAEGIVAGIGGGKFNPNGNVTGSQFAKMLLIALGYRADHEKFVGNAWEVNVNVKATQKGLYEDLATMDPAVALTRDNAAQMLWNALNAKEVKYEYTLVTENGQLVSKVTVKDDEETLLADKYGIVDDQAGRLDSFTYNSDKGEWTYKVVGKDMKATSFTADVDYTDLYKQNVKVVYTLKSNSTTKVDTLYGIIADDSVVVVSAIVDQFDTVAEKDTEVTIDGTDYDLEKAAKNIQVYTFQNANAKNDIEAVALSALDYSAAAAYEIVGIDENDNGDIDFFVVYPVSVAKVTYVGTKGITAGDPYTFEDDDIYDGVAKDDYAIITKAANSATNTNTIAKADLTNGTVTGLKSGKVQIDGTWYTNQAGTLTNGDSYDFVILNGVVKFADLADTNSKDVLYVSAKDTEANTQFDSDDATWDVKAYFTDGTGKVITVSKLDGNDVTANTRIETQKLYTYKVSGDTYELKAVSTSNDAGYDKFIEGTSFVEKTEKLAETKIADDAVIFVQYNDGVKVLTGAAMKDCNDFGTSAAVLANKTNGVYFAQVGFVYANTEAPDAVSDTLYAYVVEEPWTTTIKDDGDDVDVVAVSVWTGSEYATLYVEESTSESDAATDSEVAMDLTEGTAISYKMDGDYAIDINPTAAKQAAIVGFEAVSEGDIVYYQSNGTTKTVAMDEDVVIIGIRSGDLKNCEAADLTDLQEAQSKTDGKVSANAYVVVENGAIVALFIDLDNEIDGGKQFTEVAE